ncbi:hypothetical protein NL676_033968 [Syzygium grande]|nr:hypothetical protein NL676_033968 [Syzygium grande]
MGRHRHRSSLARAGNSSPDRGEGLQALPISCCEQGPATLAYSPTVAYTQMRVASDAKAEQPMVFLI